MKLQQFMPYRLAVVAEAVSRAIADVYRERFGLSRDEWRVLAALAEAGEMKSRDAALQATLDKMQVSRAVAGLERAGLVARSEDPADRRNRILRLSPAGRELLDELLPMVEAREAELLAALAPAERLALDAALDQLLDRVSRVRGGLS
jgi:DNA-binding MarR family transcriptional regulator